MVCACVLLITLSLFCVASFNISLLHSCSLLVSRNRQFSALSKYPHCSIDNPIALPGKYNLKNHSHSSLEMPPNPAQAAFDVCLLCSRLLSHSKTSHYSVHIITGKLHIKHISSSTLPPLLLLLLPA